MPGNVHAVDSFQSFGCTGSLQTPAHESGQIAAKGGTILRRPSSGERHQADYCFIFIASTTTFEISRFNDAALIPSMLIMSTEA